MWHGKLVRLLQKILRELDIVDVVVDLLQLPFQKGADINSIQKDQYRQLFNLMNLLYRLLKQLSKGSLTNAKAIVAHLDVFRSQLGKGILVTPTIKEVYTGKRELLNEITPDLVDHFVDLIKKDKLPQYIDFLMSICISGSENSPEPIGKVQNMVTHALLDENSVVLPAMQVSKRSDGGIRVKAMVAGEGTWMDLSEFKDPAFINPKTKKQEDYAGWIMNSALFELNEKQKIFRYMIRCTNLYGRLALGRNQTALRLLTGNSNLSLDYESILCIIKEESLPYLLRARYMTLMSRIFVERDPQTHVPSIVKTRVWSKVVPEQSDLNLSEDHESEGADAGANPIPKCETGFLDLQGYLLKAIPTLAGLKMEGSTQPSMNDRVSFGQLEFIRTQLEITETMLGYGFFRGQGQAAPDHSRARVTASVDFATPEESAGTSSAKTRFRTGSLATGGLFSYTQLRELVSGLFIVLDSRGGDVATRKTDTSIEALTRNTVRSCALRLLQKCFDIRINFRVTETIRCYEQIFESLKKDPVAYSRAASGRQSLMSQSLASMSSFTSEDSTGSGDLVVKEPDVREIFTGFEDVVEDLNFRLFKQNIISTDDISADTYQHGETEDLVCQLMLDLCSFSFPALSSSCFAILFRHAE